MWYYPTFLGFLHNYLCKKPEIYASLRSAKGLRVQGVKGSRTKYFWSLQEGD